MEVKRDKLNYYSKSADKLAGKGANEYAFDLSVYAELNKIPNWRKKLSNFAPDAVTLLVDGEYWHFRTPEHAFQSAKIYLVDRVAARLFTFGGGEIGDGDGSIAQKNRKLVRLPEDMVKIWDTRKGEVMCQITRARAEQNPSYAKVLLLTMNAELWHTVPRKAAVRQEWLEKIRDEIRDCIVL
jgi:hypothetical protein